MLQLGVYLVAAAPQCQLVVAVIAVVGVEPGHLAQCRVALNLHKVLKGIHNAVHILAHRRGGHGLRVYLKHRLISVSQLPHHHNAYQHGASLLVVHLDGVGVKVAGTQRQALCVDEGVDPIEPHALECTLIFAEEHHDAGLVGLQFDVAQLQKQGHKDEQYTGRNGQRAKAFGTLPDEQGSHDN